MNPKKFNPDKTGTIDEKLDYLEQEAFIRGEKFDRESERAILEGAELRVPYIAADGTEFVTWAAKEEYNRKLSRAALTADTNPFHWAGQMLEPYEPSLIAAPPPNVGIEDFWKETKKEEVQRNNPPFLVRLAMKLTGWSNA